MKGKAAMRLRRIGTTIVGLAVLGPPLVVALAALSGSGHRWPDILAQFTAPALMATVMAGLVLVLVRRFRWAAGAGVVGVLLTAAVWPQVLPGGPTPQADAPVVTLYSANVWADNEDVEAMAASIAEADADIVVLIEMDASVSDHLDEVLAGYPHVTAMPPLGQNRNAEGRALVASRYPVRPIRYATHQVHVSGGVVETPIGAINVVGVHLTRPWPFQYQWGQIIQTMELTSLRRSLDGPVIIAGDYNSISSARIGRQVKADQDLHPAPGWPGTWPSFLPDPLAFTIDQVWASRDLAFVDRRLGRRNGSDHRPVITRFTLARAKP